VASIYAKYRTARATLWASGLWATIAAVLQRHISKPTLLNGRRLMQRTCPAMRVDCQLLFTSVARQRAHAIS